MIRPVHPSHYTDASLSTGSDALIHKYGIRRPNKAHTATAHRVAKLFGTEFNEGPGYDIATPDVVVEVETTATMLEAAARLQNERRRVYVAMTNKDGVREALRAISTKRVGIMDPHGNVVREAESASLIGS